MTSICSLLYFGVHGVSESIFICQKKDPFLFKFSAYVCKIKDKIAFRVLLSYFVVAY